MAVGSTANCLPALTFMATPIDFLNALTARLSDVRIPFAVTSGMACVFYGIQQTTKDVDMNYMFGAEDNFDLEPGTYFVRFLRDGYDFTDANVGNDDTIDSDADQTTGAP